MASIKLNIIADLSRVTNINRYTKQNQPILVNQAANRYQGYLRKRYITLSSGAGEWPKLKRSTILRKIRRGIADNPRAILREYDAVLEAIQIRQIGQKTFVGIVRNQRHPRGKTIAFIAQVHTRGGGRLPKRRVVAPSDKRTLHRMVLDVRDNYNKIIRQNRRS